MFKDIKKKLFSHPPIVLPKKARAFCLTLQDVNENSFAHFWDKGKHYYDKQRQAKVCFGLRQALESNHPKVIYMRNEKNKTDIKGDVFRQVLIKLPLQDEDYTEHGSDNQISFSEALILELTHYYQKHMEKTPRFFSIYDTNLAPNTVEFQFGPGIYITEAKTPASFQVTLRGVDVLGKAFSYPAVVSFEQGSDHYNRVFKGQDRFFVCHPNLRGIEQTGGWFSETIDALTCQYRNNQWEVIPSGKEQRVTMQQENGVMVFHCVDTNVLVGTGQQPAYLEILLQPVGQDTPRVPTKETRPTDNVTEVADAASDYNESVIDAVISDATPNYSESVIASVIPDSPKPVLSVYALALPALARWPGLQQWRICFDHQGDIINQSNGVSLAKDAGLILTASQTENVQWSCAAQSKKLQAGQSIPFAKQSLAVWKTPDDTNYSALLQLPKAIDYSLDLQGSQAVGWYLGGDKKPDIAINLLADPAGLVWQSESNYSGSVLTQLGWHRLSFELKHSDKGYSVQRHAGTKAELRILDANLTVKQSIAKTDLKPYLLEQEDSILAGCFLMRMETR